MCRALLVLCVARDPERLRALRLAAAGAEWELAPGATSIDEALRQLEERSPHVLVVEGGLSDLISAARAVRPGLRVISVGRLPGADAEVGGLDEVRGSVRATASPGGPVRGPAP
jgi:hypothetical protein